MRFVQRFAVVLAALAGAGCGSDPITPVRAPVITLSAAQSTALIGGLQQVGALSGDLSFIGDSISLVLHAGAEARLVQVTTDFAGDDYYGVTLRRAISTNVNSQSTFMLVAFDDPDDPRVFLVLTGYVAAPPGAPPTSVQGTIGSTSVHANFFRVAGSSVTRWIGISGTASFASGASGSACDGFAATTTVACMKQPMTVSFTATALQASPQTPTPQQVFATMVSAELVGVLLTYTY